MLLEQNSKARHVAHSLRVGRAVSDYKCPYFGSTAAAGNTRSVLTPVEFVPYPLAPDNSDQGSENKNAAYQSSDGEVGDALAGSFPNKYKNYQREEQRDFRTS